MKIRLFTISPPEKDLPIVEGTRIAAQTAGGTATEIALMAIHAATRIKNVWVSLDAAVTGAATNNFTLTVKRYNAAGTLVGTVGAVTFASGTNAVKFAAFDLAILSATALANTKCDKGDSITVALVQAGTGLACPAGKVEVDYVIGGTGTY